MLPDCIVPKANLAARNTLGLPARAEFFASIETREQLAMLARHPDLSRLHHFILGEGSNLVLTGDFPGLVLKMELKGRKLADEDGDYHYVAAAAGENWHAFTQWTLKNGYPGLENLSLIPGTVGAAPVQNIGAYGVEVGDFLYELEAFDCISGEIRRFSAAECQFAYRTSVFKQEGWHLLGRYAILGVVFRLPKHWRPRAGYGDIEARLQERGIRTPTPQQVAETVMGIRREKLPDPVKLPNVGSFFQNPVVAQNLAAALTSAYPDLPAYPQADGNVKLAAGWLIEKAGWKGRNLGPVGMHEAQALVLVNRGGARFADVQNLARAVREAVFARFGIHLEPEPVFL
ncbi:MAG: UDP-N-acetylmuramate dehydrogenase [Betaproteobacteria bacterium]|nr:UDP-N-acetylmuramate dehydrogenase [Betaproteobacteria bacterium]